MLERWRDAAWVRVSKAVRGRACDDIFYVLSPGDVAVERRPVSPALPPGLYSFRVQVDLSVDEVTTIRSGAFRVLGARLPNGVRRK